MDFVWVEGGTFTMGCDGPTGNCASDEVPLHDVTITRDLAVGVTEVTQAAFASVMGYNPSTFTASHARPTCASPDCPVETVTWHEAAAFANALTARVSPATAACYTCTGAGAATSCTPVGDPYACEGFRLPTEAEWEYAARCGSSTGYAGSATLDDVAWWAGNAADATHVVGQLDANDCGLHDLSGNVWELVGDWHTIYTGSGQIDPHGATALVDWPYRVWRGGAYDQLNTHNLSVYVRGRGLPTTAAPYLGFRLARTITPR
jgi:formylglycine-generating enzyme required for sulfatase activity